MENVEMMNIHDEKLREYLEEVGDEGISKLEVDEGFSVIVLGVNGSFDSMGEMKEIKLEIEEKLKDVNVFSIANGPTSFYGLSIPITEEGSK